MGQREDVTASLLASHGVDAVARRKVADRVREVVEHGCRAIEASAADDQLAPESVTHGDVATAASAVVLASDLRASQSAASPSNPVDGICRIILPTFDRLNEDGRDGLRGFVRRVAQPMQGWRARLANVERMMAKHFDGDDLAYQDGLDDSLRDALAEVRSLLGGE